MNPAPYHPGMGSASSLARAAASAVGSVGRQSVRGVVLRSNLSPDVYLDSIEAAGPSGSIPGQAARGVRRRGGISEAFLAFAKPEIELDTVAGRITVAPWGPPTTNLFWPLMILGVASVGALGVLAYRGLSK